jgi:hypothetical protein
VSYDDIARIAAEALERCSGIAENNLSWMLRLVADGNEVDIWSDVELEELEELLNDKVSTEINDLDVDGQDWRLELYSEDELAQAWDAHTSIDVAP